MRVLIADNHPIVTSGCRTVLADESDIILLEASDSKPAERVFVAEHRDICLIDMNPPSLFRDRLVHSPYKTVANTSSIIRQKLGARTSAELVRFAIESGVA